VTTLAENPWQAVTVHAVAGRARLPPDLEMGPRPRHPVRIVDVCPSETRLRIEVPRRAVGRARRGRAAQIPGRIARRRRLVMTTPYHRDPVPDRPQARAAGNPNVARRAVQRADRVLGQGVELSRNHREAASGKLDAARRGRIADLHESTAPIDHRASAESRIGARRGGRATVPRRPTR